MRLIVSLVVVSYSVLGFSQTMQCRPVGAGAVECTTTPGFEPKSLLEAYEDQRERIQRRRAAELEAELLRLQIQERMRQLQDQRERRPPPIGRP